MSQTGSFNADAQASKDFSLSPGQTARYAVEAPFLGEVFLEQAEKGLQGWKRLASFQAPVDATFRNTSSVRVHLRLRCVTFLPVAQRIAFDGTPASGTLTLDYDGDTAAVDHDEGAAELQAALRLM